MPIPLLRICESHWISILLDSCGPEFCLDSIKLSFLLANGIATQILDTSPVGPSACQANSRTIIFLLVDLFLFLCAGHALS